MKFVRRQFSWNDVYFVVVVVVARKPVALLFEL